MDKLLEKIGIYDFFVRLLTGVTIMLGAKVFGIIGTITLPDNDAVYIAVLIIAGYVIGIIFEELLYIILGKLRKKTKDKGNKAKNDKTKIDEDKRKKLIAAGYEGRIEIPLINAVMSGSYAVACGIFAFLYIIKMLFNLDIIPGNGLSVESNLCILIFLTVIFVYRYHHFLVRRCALIDRYYDAFCKNDSQ